MLISYLSGLREAFSLEKIMQWKSFIFPLATGCDLLLSLSIKTAYLRKAVSLATCHSLGQKSCLGIALRSSNPEAQAS